jgi:FMN-dependent NADH-azoreductase
MDRREFFKVSGAGLMTLLLSGCGLSALAEGTGASKQTGSAGAVSGGKKMNIVVIAGSPHNEQESTSKYLAQQFMRGAQEAGHDVFRFNAALEDIHGCLGCDACHMDGPCVQQDAIETKLIQRLVDCDMIVLDTPLYYYGPSAQTKMVIDRFYSRTGRLTGKKSMLMATAYNSADWTMDALVTYYDTLVRYMKWTDAGKVLAIGCGARSLVEQSQFGQQAYSIGKNV